ncbi:stage II sporulation protein P [Clostridium sp.]|uniref:stage II sporulation protein P n=1 Tax=Clostridium sp. TaxID=1506 RepID=UPI003D6D3BAB
MKMSMNNKGIKEDGMVRIFLGVFTFIIIILISLIIPKSARADNNGGYKNYFYVNVINNVLSVIQPSESEINMKTEVLSFLGIDVLNPITIIAKEVSYLDLNKISSEVNSESNEEENLITFILNPFKIDDKQVTRSNAKSNGINVIADLYNPTLKQTLDKAKPRVLIYHSHTTESYLASEKDTTKSAFNMDLTKNVCAVGNVIKEELEKNYGIAVIHDETLHNVGDYNASYKKSGITLDKYLKAYGDFDLVIDIHRDGIENKNLVTTKINGENVAQIMFVMAKGNPRYAKQKKLVDSMIGISNKIYPNLLKNLEITTVNRGIDFYNQNKSDNSVLIEVGTYTNTITEVENTGKYLSRIFAEQLNGKK